MISSSPAIIRRAGRLAAARWPDQDHELAVPDLQVEVLDRLEIAVVLVDVVERHGRHGQTSAPSGPSRALASSRRGGRGRAPYEGCSGARIVRGAATSVQACETITTPFVVMVLTGKPVHHRAMDTTTPKRTDDRTRALRRLRNVTIGTTLASIAATTGIGLVAANTHPGTTATTAPVSATTSTTGSTGSTNTTGSTSTTTGTSTTNGTSSSTSSTSTATPSPTTSTSGVSSSSGRAQVSTGGS